MVTFRLDSDFVNQFDKVARRHNRDRTKEVKQLMLEAIQKEFPDYKLPDAPPSS